MVKPDCKTGPVVLKSLERRNRFRGEANGKPAWVRFGDPAINLYTVEQAEKIDPGEDAIFVEVLNQAPGFDGWACDPETVQGALRKDWDLWSRHKNELVRENGEIKRLVGLHADQHDLYYTLQLRNGEVNHVSMTFGIELVRGSVSETEYASLDADMSRAGAMPVDSFSILREIDKPWPRPSLQAAVIVVTGVKRGLIFGPFDTRDTLDAFLDAIKGLPMSRTASSWEEAFLEHPSYRGIEPTRDLLEHPPVDMSQWKHEDFLSSFLPSFWEEDVEEDTLSAPSEAPDTNAAM